MSEISLSMMTRPVQPPLDNYTARLRHKLHAEIANRRQVERENLRLRQELARLQQRMRKPSLTSSLMEKNQPMSVVFDGT